MRYKVYINGKKGLKQIPPHYLWTIPVQATLISAVIIGLLIVGGLLILK